VYNMNSYRETMNNEQQALSQLPDLVDKSFPELVEFQHHQPSLSFDSSSDVEQDQVFLLSDAERDVRDRAREQAKQAKRAAQHREDACDCNECAIINERYESKCWVDVFNHMTLDDFFSLKKLTPDQQVSMCRAFASYVRTVYPATPRAPKKGRSKK